MPAHRISRAALVLLAGVGLGCGGRGDGHAAPEDTTAAPRLGIEGAVLAGTAADSALQAAAAVVVLEGNAIRDPAGRRNGAASVLLRPGETVAFVNRDAVAHTVTAAAAPPGGAPFDSGPLQEGEVYAFRPAVEGTWSFFCALHPGVMRGATLRVRRTP